MSYTFQTILDSLRASDSEATDHVNDLNSLRDEIETAIAEIEDYQNRIHDAIDAIESLDDLSVDYTFSYSLEDVSLSADI